MNKISFPFFKTWSSQDVDNFIELVGIDGPTNFIINRHEEKNIIDLSSMSFQASFGLVNKSIQHEIIKQVSSKAIATPAYYSQYQLDVTSKLIKFINLKGRVFYTVSGAESIENGLKILRCVTGKNIILSRKKSYHGATLGALNISGDWRREGHVLPKGFHDWIPEPEDDPEFKKSAQLIEQIGPDNIAGICVETISGKNGVLIPPQSWWDGLDNARKKYKIKVILDEIICGFYRTSTPFGYNHFNFIPDIVCLGKAISGGMVPLGATFLSEEISNYFDKNTLSAGLTNYAHPLGLAALNSVLNLINTSDFQTTLNQNSNLLKSFSENFVQNKNVKDVRLIGMLMAIDLKEPRTCNYFIERGIHLVVNNNSIILAPALTYETKTLEQNLLHLERIIGE